ncbi:MAG: hypothetical protein JXB62_15350 [Pirellulales bacterium]|nr:hypothetical protein [Pirellulales bacterium]
MRKICVVFCLLAVAVFAASNALALEIRVAPATLVLSSPGGNLTVHTDVDFEPGLPVTLVVNDQEVTAHTFADSLGNLVAQCSKEAAKDAIGDFSGKWTTAIVTLTVCGESASEQIRVKK